jgi:hypothetical protein
VEETTEQTRIVETTVGRALLWDIVPAGLSFDMINQPMVEKGHLAGDQPVLPRSRSEVDGHLR